ncbi:hypothetical protein [Microbulbifer halophilus]|uniref:hypothetical protein n=1 Tax=Microbulbifer halophilus TaxID=453963 RepID=UPI0036088E39
MSNFVLPFRRFDSPALSIGRGRWSCSPLHNHSATQPYNVEFCASIPPVRLTGTLYRPRALELQSAA